MFLIYDFFMSTMLAVFVFMILPGECFKVCRWGGWFVREERVTRYVVHKEDFSFDLFTRSMSESDTLEMKQYW